MVWSRSSENRWGRGLVGIAGVSIGLLAAGCAGADAAPDRASRRPVAPRPSCFGKSKQAGDRTVDLVWGGRKRSALVHAPSAYDPLSPTPLVLAYHFAGGNALWMEQATRLNDAADRARVIVAFPEGVDGSFNAGKCCGKAWEENVDDVGFARALIGQLSSDYCIDAGRVFATGMSNGGMMVYRLGCEMTDRLAGIAVVAATLHTADACRPSRSIPLLHIHGTADGSIPYDGGQGKPPLPTSGNFELASVESSVKVFRSIDGCSAEERPTYHRGDTTCVEWAKCAAGTRVELCTVEGGGHTWPGGFLPPMLGKTSQDLNASAEVMAFFLAKR
jgi:polyhydroxybutyrate depolymerase